MREGIELKIEESGPSSIGGVGLIKSFADAQTAQPLKLVVALLLLLKLLLPFLVHSDWGFHRDELLYLAMGDHLGWGYLEVPPMIALFGAIADALFGTWVAGVRLLPSLAAAVTLWLTVRITADLGGGRWAQLLAALGFTVGVIYLRANILFQPVVFEQLAYVAAAWLLVRALLHERASDWLWLGAVVGAGLLTKYTILLFLAGAFVGLILSRQRSQLKTPWPWLAAGLALVIWSPNLVWQWQEGFPVIEHMGALASRQLAHVDPVTFLLSQALVNLYGTPIWLIGLWWCLLSAAGERLRPIAWLYLGNLAVLLLFSGKIYYLAPAYAMLLAAGAVAIESMLQRRQARRWLVAIPLVVFFGSLATVPIAIPLLSIESTITFGRFGMRYLGLAEAFRWEDGSIHDLPQDYADMLGWREQAQAVAAVFDDVGPADIAASNYGQAGALVRYGDELGLPPVISKSSSFWLWGFGHATGDPMIFIGEDAQNLSGLFHEVKEIARVSHPYARETDVPIVLVSRPRESMPALWEILKKYRY
ncbi:MAG: glycosyltransferase family 39 protein [Gemmatimonadetes bacterium]|nr:glycosyltransferase family 39 protein [Gemmatimonadota bacterium]MBT4609604.1 glycosyltransferase family 39 protein [Gemmatimonadota bacterium]MBT5059408.1 glycosyltransferase family 39 protein [Gemmatimonadota bacterium]MBT5146297.1 glycosyltransferase family 39 protein [Gemmatimonadota bacterium]MBT5591220.1 glycosyltransferase family 39 protein [Gemmatimonadota bacterium]